MAKNLIIVLYLLLYSDSGFKSLVLWAELSEILNILLLLPPLLDFYNGIIFYSEAKFYKLNPTFFLFNETALFSV